MLVVICWAAEENDWVVVCVVVEVMAILDTPLVILLVCSRDELCQEKLSERIATILHLS